MIEHEHAYLLNKFEGVFKLLNFIEKTQILKTCRLKLLFSAFQSLGGPFLKSMFLNIITRTSNTTNPSNASECIRYTLVSLYWPQFGDDQYFLARAFKANPIRARILSTCKNISYRRCYDRFAQYQQIQAEATFAEIMCDFSHLILGIFNMTSLRRHLAIDKSKN